MDPSIKNMPQLASSESLSVSALPSAAISRMPGVDDGTVQLENFLRPGTDPSTAPRHAEPKRCLIRPQTRRPSVTSRPTS